MKPIIIVLLLLNSLSIAGGSQEKNISEPVYYTHFNCGTRTARKVTPESMEPGIPEGEPPTQFGAPMPLNSLGHGETIVKFSKSAEFKDDLIIKVNYSGYSFVIFEIYKNNIQVGEVTGEGSLSFSDFTSVTKGAFIITSNRKVSCWLVE